MYKRQSTVRDLGVVVDQDLSLAAHVSHVITSVCFFQSPVCGEEAARKQARWKVVFKLASTIVGPLVDLGDPKKVV